MKQAIRFTIIILVVSFFACTSSDDFCLSNQDTVQTTFYSSYTDDDSTVSAVTIYGIYDMEAIDSLISDSASVSSSFLPLSMMHDSTSFVIEIDNTKDTLTFVHTKELSYVSDECGFIFKFELDTVLFTDISFIDSVSIVYSDIIYNENIENVQIYLY